MVEGIKTRLGSVDVAISGSTMVQTILCKQWHTSDIDIYGMPAKLPTVRAWLWNKLRFIFVDFKTRNHAYVWDRAHPGIRHAERFALLLMDGASFIDCTSRTTWTFDLSRVLRAARMRRHSDDEEYDSEYKAICDAFLGGGAVHSESEAHTYRPAKGYD